MHSAEESVYHRLSFNTNVQTSTATSDRALRILSTRVLFTDAPWLKIAWCAATMRVFRLSLSMRLCSRH